MSDESTQSDARNQARSVLNQEEGVDWLLAYIIGMAEMSVEIGVTLTIGGQVISGTVISGRRYFKELAEGFATSTVSKGMEGLRESLKSGFSQFADLYPKPEDADLSPKPKFIHLTNTKFVLGNKLTGGGPQALWRGKLAAVDGFTVGSLKES
jgi:hypothetical protein